MLHLFNKVYLKPDAQFARSKHCVIISPNAEYLTDDRADVNAVEFGTVYYAATTYQQLLTHFDDSEDIFFQWLLNFDPSTRLTVYCDPQTFNHLTLKWFKTVLVNADDEAAFKIVRLSYLRYAYLWGYPYLPYLRLNETQAANFKQAGNSMITYEEFLPAWTDAEPFNVDHNVLAPVVSLEFQLASYLVDPTWVHADIVRTKLVTMVKKLHVRKFIDGKHGILQGLYTQPGFDIFNQTLVDYVTAHKEFTPLVDPQVLPDEYEYVYDTYLTPELTEKFIGRYKEIAGNPLEEGLPEAKFLDPNITADEIIAIEKQSPFLRVNLGLWEYYETVNIYLLHHIFNLSNTNSPSELKKISLLTE